MKVTIDNQDGKGAIDYSSALCADQASEKAVVITRALNQPTIAKVQLDCASHGFGVPIQNAFVTITAEDGTFLFTGYLPSAAEPIFAGYDSTGPHYRVVLHAISEDWLLNRDALPQAAPLLGETAGAMVRIITNRVNPSLVQMNGLEDVGTIGFFQPLPNLPWSENVAALANQARAAYRVLNGQLTLAPIGSTVHNLDDTVGLLEFAEPSAGEARQVVNDVTITGLDEPLQYVTELFEGDGSTALFQLQREPYPVAKPILLNEEFAGPGLNTSVWNVDDSGGYLTVGGGGLTLGGGAGADGTTTLTAIDPVELGGEIVIEAGFVQLNSGSVGVLCGLYSGEINEANCIAGYRVKTNGTTTVLVPFVDGTEVGTAFTLQQGHSYILRLHVHSGEFQRMLNSYFSYGNGGPTVYGGGTVQSPLQLLFELQDTAVLPYVNIGSTILYDGTVGSSPAIASFACVNSVDLQGTIGYFKVTRPGTMWVVSTPSSGTSFTRRIGANTQGADCNVLRNGFLHFYKLAIPQPGEMLAVTYRVGAPSVARVANSTAPQPGGTGTPAVSQWVGHLFHPPARSSVDCENACQALLDVASNPAATWKGTYRFRNLQNQSDIWPGDALDFTSPAAGMNVKVIVRRVNIQSTSSSPEVIDYAVSFANDWAETISLKLGTEISSDMYLPQQPETSESSHLANLNSLQVTSISGSSITVNAGLTPPSGGGFEVRSQDYTFGAANGQGLVLRSPVPNFTITRSADEENFFVRMYDASTPPIYSRISSMIITNVPTS